MHRSSLTLGMALCFSLACSASAPPAGQVAGTGSVAATNAPVREEGFLGDTSKLALTPAQSAIIEAGRQNLKIRALAVRDARKAAAVELADEIQAGHFDEAKLGQKSDEFVRAMDAQRTAFLEALNRAHAALTPEQRHLAAESMRGQHGHRFEKGGRMHGGWQHGPGGEHAGEHEHFGHFAAELGLTPEQKDQVRTQMQAAFQPKEGEGKPDFRGMKGPGRFHALADAFEKDSFDARAVEMGENAGKFMRSMAEHRISAAKILSGVLTPEQRTKFVQSLRTHSPERGPGLVPAGESDSE